MPPLSTKNPEEVIRCGMAEIPSTSRLYEAIEKVLEGYNSGTSEKDFFEDLHKRWNEQSSHDWCHTISNAEIVAACLLYGQKDYARSVGMAVEQGFDTDCNGATVGSILGVMLGGKRYPKDSPAVYATPSAPTFRDTAAFPSRIWPRKLWPL